MSGLWQPAPRHVAVKRGEGRHAGLYAQVGIHVLLAGTMARIDDLQTVNEARVLKLEEKIAYQEKTIADLNEVVVSLHRATDELSGRLQVIERVLRDEVGAREMRNEPPPHY